MGKMSAMRRRLNHSLRRLSRNLRRHRHQIMRLRKIAKSAGKGTQNATSGEVDTGNPSDVPGVTSSNGLLKMPLPAVSPFLYQAEKAKQLEYAKRGRNIKDESVSVSYLTASPPTPLCKAGTAQMFDDEVDVASDENSARLVAAVLYARYHDVDSSTLARYVIPKRLRQNEAVKKALLDRIFNDCNRYQTRIMSFYLAGVTAFVKEMGGLEAWKGETSSARLKMFERAFSMCPLDTAIAALGPVAFAVPLMDIFSDTSDEHLKWQNFHRQVFVHVCEYVFTLRLASTTDRKRDCFSNWRSLMGQTGFRELDLGGMDDVPVTWGSLVSRRIRHPRATSEVRNL